MNSWIRRTLQVGLVSAGFVLVAGATAAQASVHSIDNDGVLNGTQVVAPVQLPVNICGNAVGILGNAVAGCEGGATAKLHSAAGGSGGVVSKDNDGVLNGTQIVAPIQAPVEISGNAVGAVLGSAVAGSNGGATATKSAPAGGSSMPGVHSIDNDGVLNGTQIVAPIQVPIDACGNAVGAVLGNAEAGCIGGATAKLHSAPGGSGGGVVSKGNDGVLNGTQVVVPVQIPINVCGNAVGVLGDAVAGCKGGATATHGGHKPGTSTDSGDEHQLPVDTKNAGWPGNPGTPGTPGLPDLPGTGILSAGNDGVLNGTQVVAPIQVPIDACGNAVALLGSAEAGCEGGATAKNTFSGKVVSWDNDGIGNGTQVVAPVQIPVDVSGNAVGILGSALAGSHGGSTAQLW
ncbi:MAG: hypothetical protein QOI35_1203 [Cryptosporangiaceae bacterium]|jgi:hypothetical protein|nr:hypothetical protein [Cryptosporangiaceae bacterium]MDQ1655588.1 hypothetical protein [Cryptosporangiaceae bacterium]